MTGREKLFTLLKGGKLDPPPFWLLFPYHPTSYYVDVRNSEHYRPIHELALRHGITLNRRNLGCGLFTSAVSADAEGCLCCGELRLGRPGGKLLREDEDLDLLLELPVLTDPVEIERQLDARLEQYRKEKAEFPEEYGAMMLDLGEPVNFLYHNSDLESFAVWSITAPEKIKRFLDRNMERLRTVYRYCLERDLADVYFMVGSELASPPMFSRDTFRDWIVPYASELNRMVHDRGKFVIQHYHGQIREILEDFLEMAPDALHTIESPPTGNCTLKEAFEIVGDRMVLIGNVQYDQFRSSTPEQMAETVRTLRRQAAGRRFILSPTAGPFDPEPPEQLQANYRSFIAAAVE